jgi:flavin reductase (DIM6/NTAB) family NADH-FMN oxidoreductase RutF
MKQSLGPKTLIYPTPVWIVCTYDRNGKANAMTAAWGGVCCSKPPCVGISLQKVRYTYDAILERKVFTINVPSQDHVSAADYFGVASGKDEDKFAVTGLTPVRGEFVNAPYISEFPVILECRLLHTVEIGLHTQFIGEILDVKADEKVLKEDGNPDIELIRPIIYATGARTYHALGEYLGKAYSIGDAFRQQK